MQYRTNLEENKTLKHFHSQELLDPLASLMAPLVPELLVLPGLPGKGTDGEQRWLKAEASRGFCRQNSNENNKKTDLQLAQGVLVVPVVRYYLADPV